MSMERIKYNNFQNASTNSLFASPNCSILMQEFVFLLKIPIITTVSVVTCQRCFTDRFLCILLNQTIFAVLQIPKTLY